MKNLFIYTFLILAASLGLLSCDSTTAPGDLLKDIPVISNLTISPQNVQFSPEMDGIKDTTVVVDIVVITKNNDEIHTPVLSITDRMSNQQVLQEEMNASDSDNEFTFQIPFETKTTFFEEYIVTAQIKEHPETNYAQGVLNLIGFSVIKPEILNVNNPESVQKPASGTDLYPFTALVTDEEGDDTIEGVFVRIISPESGEVNNSPFQLFDDGDQGDDNIAGDGIYTITFPVDGSSQAVTFNLLYYAIDKGGLVSDTVKSTFSITE
ncbi:MAG: hypothetical protein WD022_11685 [Balneolaceae bacterium]